MQKFNTDFAGACLGSVMYDRKSALAVSKSRTEAEATSPVETPPSIANAPEKARKSNKVARKAA